MTCLLQQLRAKGLIQSEDQDVAAWQLRSNMSCCSRALLPVVSRIFPKAGSRKARSWPSLQVGRGCFAPPPSPSPASRALRLPPASRGRTLCALDSSACLMQSLQRLRMRWCSQMLPPPQSLHWLLLRWCSQMADPPQSLHWLRWRWCSQMADPPQSLHRLRMRWCSQMADPPQSLHSLLLRWCSQMLPPPQSLHRLRMRWCSQRADPPQSLHRLRMRWCSQQADPPHSLHACHSRWCSKKAGPPHSLHRLRMRRCSQIDVRLPYSLHLAFCRWCTRSFCRLLSPRPNPTPGDDAALAWARAARLPCRGCRPTGARSHRAVAHCRGTRYPVT